jgi:uncharacterized coiled-coil DUF342 family protein
MKKMKKLTKEQRKVLGFGWKKYLELRAEGNKLWAEGNKLRAEGDKLWAEGNKLRAEGDKLRAEGDKLCAEGDKLRAEGNKLRAEGDKLWAEVILYFVGNIKIEWIWRDSDYDCKLETGDIFRHNNTKL